MTSESTVAVGRAITSRKLRVDEVLGLDATDLRRNGAFARPFTRRGGPIWTLVDGALLHRTAVRYVVWGNGGPPKSVVVWPDQGGDLRLPEDDSFWVVGLTRTVPNYSRGTPRFWLLCPQCGRRCRVVYLVPEPSRLGCRLCLDLAYTSQLECGTWLWAVIRAFKAERALIEEMIRPRRSERTLAAAWQRYQKAHEAVLTYKPRLRR